jgi:nitrite reductase/ring-hydroxylating ferredoxin subunit
VTCLGRCYAARFIASRKRRPKVGVSYIPVARVGELTPGVMKEVDLGGRQVLLTFAEGKYFAFSRTCPHEEADLKTAGQLLAGGKIRCNNHSYCYDLESGECTLPKGAAPLTVLPAEERGEEICIRLEW